MSEMKVTSELENELSLALEEAAERANRLECDRDALLAAAKEGRDALLWIQGKLDKHEDVVIERGWNEEISVMNRAILEAES